MAPQKDFQNVTSPRLLWNTSLSKHMPNYAAVIIDVNQELRR